MVNSSSLLPLAQHKTREILPETHWDRKQTAKLRLWCSEWNIYCSNSWYLFPKWSN